MNHTFEQLKRVYFVGIKGIAMAALAVWAKERGLQVSGSDVDETFPSDPVLKKAGIKAYIGFSETHITGSDKPDLVIYTGAHGGRDNPEVKAAQKLGITVIPHGRALGIAMKEKRQISIAGSHGKTTTTAMIATVLEYAGLHPSYAVGCGEIRGLGLPGHYGTGEFFVAEADEYITDPSHDNTPRFLWQKPEILVVTNIDYDHPDAYASIDEVQNAFIALKKQQVGLKLTVVNADDPVSQPLLATTSHGTVITYGQSRASMYRVFDIAFPSERTTFNLSYHDKVLGEITLKIPGLHNALNAAASAVVCLSAGVSWKNIQLGLTQYQGAKRRFEKIMTTGGITFYDDYAHHPKEIQATLNASRSWYPKGRIIAIFQPHTYSRTKKLLVDFGRAFSDADIVMATDIYASARENDTLGIDGMTLIREIKKYHGNVIYTPRFEDVRRRVSSLCKSGDVVIFMGAGDIYMWEKKVCKALHR